MATHYVIDSKAMKDLLAYAPVPLKRWATERAVPVERVDVYMDIADGGCDTIVATPDDNGAYWRRKEDA